MATNKKELSNKFASKRQSSSAESARKINLPAKGTDVFFETADNTAKTVEVEKSENKSQEKTTTKIADQEKSQATPSTKSKKKPAKTKPAAVEKAEELIKTTVYIEEENFLALEDIQLKLKRQEKRRVTKNELFNKAITLLIEHYKE